MVVTRNEWGDNTPGKPASPRRRFTMRQMSTTYKAFFGQLAGLLVGRPEEGSILAGIPEPGRIQVFKDHLLDVVPDRDLARLAAFFLEVQHPLIAGMIKTDALEGGNRAGPRRR